MLAAIAGLLVLAYGSGRLTQRGADRETTAAARAATSLQLAGAWRVRFDSARSAGAALRAQLAQLAHAVTGARRRADSLGQVGDSLALVLARARTPADSVRACVAGWTSCAARVAAVQAEAAATATALQLVTTDRDRWRASDSAAAVVQDSLGVALRGMQRAASCRLLLWRCPSRGATFGVGAVVGAIGVLFLHR